MKRLGLALLLCPMLAMAQNSGTQLLPAVPPPPPEMIPFDQALEPQVVIKKKGEDVIEEHRVKGKLFRIKVTPPHGVSYYLVDERGNGEFIRRELQEGMTSVPMWVIGTF